MYFASGLEYRSLHSTSGTGVQKSPRHKMQKAFILLEAKKRETRRWSTASRLVYVVARQLFSNLPSSARYHTDNHVHDAIDGSSRVTPASIIFCKSRPGGLEPLVSELSIEVEGKRLAVY